MQRFDFSRQGKHAHIDLVLDPQLKSKFAFAPRVHSYTGALSENWKETYFRMFLAHEADQGVLAELQQEIGRNCGKNSGDEWVATALDFVQSGIDYDHATAFNIAGSKIRYPSETLFDRMGVCADKTILLAAILKDSGYGLAIFNFERANHMALGILVPDQFGNFYSNYALMETTAASPIGQIPDRYAGGVRLDSKPEIVKISNGSLQFMAIIGQKRQEAEDEKLYGRTYLQMSFDKQVIFREMHVLKQAMDESNNKLKICKGRLDPVQYAECQRLTDQHNTNVAKYNDLVNRFNSL